MKMEDDKKKIAAITAVLTYLQAEQEAFQQDSVLPGYRPPPPSMVGLWNNSGRQAEMLHRTMVQMRQVPGWNK